MGDGRWWTVLVVPATKEVPRMHVDGQRSREWVSVGGRRVVIVRGTRTQTVSICTERNQPGRYQSRYRMPIEADIRAEDLDELPDLQSLQTFLESHNGQPEIGGKASPASLPSLIDPPGPEDAWLQSACAATDKAVTALVEEFRHKPFLHRVEHSLHAWLYGLLVRDSILNQQVRLGNQGEYTQLVHKEWPETTPREHAGNARPRGLFDLVVLAPGQLEQASLAQFRQGRISAPIVIEVGLDYGLGHLQQDIDKLKNSDVRCPYLLHLSRVRVRDQAKIESALLELPAKFKTACVHLDPGTGVIRYKHVDQSQFTDQPSLGGGVA